MTPSPLPAHDEESFTVYEEPSKGWALDTACTMAMTLVMALFMPGSMVPDHTRVLIASGHVVVAEAKGIVDFLLGGSLVRILRVLYVPDLAQSLLRVSQLGKKYQIGVHFLPQSGGRLCRFTYKGDTLVNIPPSPHSMWTVDSDHLAAHTLNM
jgi:hypothetical protein